MTRIVGLTGNIASGKSSVARLLSALGATVIDADRLAREAVAPGTEALAAIAARWPEAIAADGTLDRAHMRQVAFSDPAARAELEAIVHPAVGRLRDREMAAARLRGDALAVYDIPLLFEAGLAGEVDVVVLVDAPVDVRRARLLKRGLTAAEADAMMAAQIPSAQKRELADHVIDNDGSIPALQGRVGELWDALARE